MASHQIDGTAGCCRVQAIVVRHDLQSFRVGKHLIAAQAVAIAAAQLLVGLVSHCVEAIVRLGIADLEIITKYQLFNTNYISMIQRSYLAEKVIVQRHLALRIDIFEIPSKAFAFQFVAKSPSFADITSHGFSGTCFVFFFLCLVIGIED